MKRNKEFYQVKIMFVHENFNNYRIYETNDFEDAKTTFIQAEATFTKRSYNTWTLTLEKHLPKNHIQIIKLRTIEGCKVDSPLY